MHVGCGWSLRETAVQAKLARIADCVGRDFVEPVGAILRLAAAVVPATLERQRRKFGTGVERATSAGSRCHGGEETG